MKTVKGEGRKSAEPAVKYVLSEEHGLEVIFHQAANISEPSSSEPSVSGVSFKQLFTCIAKHTLSSVVSANQ